MNELINSKKTEDRIRWKLLATASAITLLGYSPELAARNDEPQVWIELGGELTRQDVRQEGFQPSFMNTRPAMFNPSTDFEELPHQSIDEIGKLSFNPSGSDWTFAVGVHYGRSVRRVNVNQQTFPKPLYSTSIVSGHVKSWGGYHGPLSAKFAKTTMQAYESHLVLDFQAGKDVGLGLLGGTSQINVGVRFAQFDNKSNVTLNSDPDWKRQYKYAPTWAVGIFPSIAGVKFWRGEGYHNHNANLQAQRSFHGLGPVVSWNGSSPIVGNHEDGELLVDYGASLAVLFGRQRAKVAHQTSGNYHSINLYYGQRGQRIQTKLTGATYTRSRKVVVPNVSGFGGVTYRIRDFKFSAGYRADFFFNAMDGGNDMRKSERIGNYGPFATISIGLGG